MVEWLVRWFVGWLVGRLIDWLVFVLCAGGNVKHVLERAQQMVAVASATLALFFFSPFSYGIYIFIACLEAYLQLKNRRQDHQPQHRSTVLREPSPAGGVPGTGRGGSTSTQIRRCAVKKQGDDSDLYQSGGWSFGR